MSNKSNFKGKMEVLGHTVATNLLDFIDNETNKTSSFYQKLITLFETTIKTKLPNCKFNFFKSYTDANQNTFNLYVSSKDGKCLDDLKNNLPTDITGGYNSAKEFYLQMKGMASSDENDQENLDKKLANLYGGIVPSEISQNKLTRADFQVEGILDDINRIKKLING
jgi:hypothetical protein